MELSPLRAISPIDGRYRPQSAFLDEYFSEYALIRYRVLVEVEYFFFLEQNGFFEAPEEIKDKLRNASDHFTESDAVRVKEIESTTNHDVKAVEYLLKEKAGNAAELEWIHFGLTSQDINNTAIPLAWKHFIQRVYEPAVQLLSGHLKKLAEQWKGIAMLARTHGQPASPTRLGKEFMVFAERIQHQLVLLSSVPFAAKFGGATGNFNAHHAAFPDRDWPALADRFVSENLGLSRMQFTTQIEHYDHLAAQFDCIKRINTILTDCCRDLWAYIGMDYFKQAVKPGEVGSSAMPHKVNPIDFENAEGNFGIANALLEYLSGKLPVSRLQRDLTDSTVLRNIGVPAAHTVIALKSLEKGLGKLVLNPEKLERDLEDNWAVVAEAVQTILRREGYPKPYEALKDLTRGKGSVTRGDMQTFISQLNVREEVREELLKITPHNYTGVSPEFPV